MKGHLAALVTVLLAPGLLSGAEPRRVVAVGDVHGALGAFREILLEAELIDDEDNWAGGEAILVQTGDFVDRGAASIDVARWLMELQRQAEGSGGRVIVILGNHESMNLMGDLRFVPPEMLAPMVDAGSEKRRNAMCKERVAILRRSAKDLGQKAASAYDLRKRCLEEHPLGLVEYQQALRPGSPLGDWLRSLPALVRIDGTVFVHGGISPEIEVRGDEAFNRKVREELERFEGWRRFLVDAGRMLESATLTEMARAVQVTLELARREALSEETGGQGAAEEANPEDPSSEELDPEIEASGLSGFFEMSDSLQLSSEGPLWFRGYHSWSEEEGLREMPKILASLGAERIVVGHTPQDPPEIRCRFGGRVFLIDTGMLTDYYGGVPAALEFQGGKIEAIYVGKRVKLREGALVCGRPLSEGNPPLPPL